MSTTQVTNKHRATEPVPPIDRTGKAGAHRESRVGEYVLAVLLAVVLVALVLVLVGRS